MENQESQLKSDPLVSVLMTVYNRSEFLADAILSVLNSTWVNFELIIVDDCSSDSSYSIAQQFSLSDERVKTFQNQTNLGDYNNRNRAAALANGKYIKYVDADDLIYPHCLEIMVQTMENYPEAALGISQEVLEDNHPYPFIMTPHETFVREFLKRGVLGLGPTGTIIRKDKFEEMEGFSGTRHIGDIELWQKLAARYPVVKIQSGLIFWRRHESQEIAREWKHPEVLALRYNHALRTITLINCPLTKEEQLTAVGRLNKRHARVLLNLAFKKLKPKQSWLVFVQSDISFFELLKALLLN